VSLSRDARSLQVGPVSVVAQGDRVSVNWSYQDEGAMQVLGLINTWLGQFVPSVKRSSEKVESMQL